MAAICDLCNVNASFGFPGGNSVRCKAHIVYGMIRYPQKICYCGNSNAIWGKSEDDNRRCDYHRQQTDKNLTKLICKSCNLYDKLDNDDLCSNCRKIPIHKNNYLKKQREIKNYLESAGYKIELYDKMIDGGICNKRRPDFVIDGLYRKIVIEIDEFQHSRENYSNDCEYTRMWDIVQSLGMSTTFIRFNPDSYKLNSNNMNPTIKSRMNTLFNCIDSLLTTETEEIASVIYLYYDNFKTFKIESLADPFNQFKRKKTWFEFYIKIGPFNFGIKI